MRTRFSITYPALFTVSVLALCIAGCSSIRSQRVIEHTQITEDSVGLVKQGYDTLGRRWATAEAPVVVARPAEPPKAVPETKVETRQGPEYASVDLKTGLVNLNKRVPTTASIGEEYAYDLTVTAVEDSGFIVVTDTIPDGATYVKSEPEATREGNLLTWRFPAMRKGEAKNIKVWLKADREGDLTGCATITAVPRGCVSTFVGKPTLAIAKTGPETALLGSEINYTIVVKNTGSTVAKGVVVTDAVPEGLTHSSGQTSLSFNVGDLAPNESKTITVPFKAGKRGQVCNTAVATSANAGKVQSEACTVVVQPGLKVMKVGDNEQFLTRSATYLIVVTNTGDTTLTGVVVTDTAPEPTSIVSAEGANVSGNTATWNLAQLKPAEVRTFSVKLTSKTPGNHCNTVTATDASNLRDSAQACTVWKGVPAILLEVVDDPDPIQVGETSTYTIRVTNQGTADDNNVTIVANFPPETTPVEAPGGTITGKAVVFPAVPTLGAKQSITYTIKARGVQGGDARLKVLLTSDMLKTPVTEEESTHVY